MKKKSIARQLQYRLGWGFALAPICLWLLTQDVTHLWLVELFHSIPVLMTGVYLVLALIFLIWRFWWSSIALWLVAVWFMQYVPTKTVVRQADCSEGIQVFQHNLNFDNQNIKALNQWLTLNQPDLVVLQEVSPKSGRQIEAVGSVYPYRYGGQPLVGYPSGQLILSKTPLYGLAIDNVSPRDKVIHGIWRLADGHEISLITAHPPSPRTQSLWQQRNQVLDRVEQLRRFSALPSTLVVGDFNLSSTTIRFNTFLNDFETAAVSSWPNWGNTTLSDLLPSIAIDHLWLKSPHLEICQRSRVEALSDSDHFAIISTLLIRP